MLSTTHVDGKWQGWHYGHRLARLLSGRGRPLGGQNKRSRDILLVGATPQYYTHFSHRQPKPWIDKIKGLGISCLWGNNSILHSFFTQTTKTMNWQDKRSQDILLVGATTQYYIHFSHRQPKAWIELFYTLKQLHELCYG